MALTDLLAPNETINYQHPRSVKYYDGGSEAKDFQVYLTNQRLMFYRQEGLIRKSDVLFAWSKADLNGISYQEKGLITKKGFIFLGGSGTNVRGTVEGKSTETRQLYQQLQAYAVE